MIALSAAPASAPRAAQPAVTLTVPAAGAVLTAPTESYAGSAGTAPGDASDVTVNVYSGTTVGGPVLASYVAQVNGDGTYSITAPVDLAQGEYTAQTSQPDGPVSTSESAPVTFGIDSEPPALELRADGTRPSRSPRPTLSGSGDTSVSASPSLTVAFFRGGETDSTPIDIVDVVLGPSGTFTAQPNRALPDGAYTALAEQAGPVAEEYSDPVALTIKARPPAVTVTTPSPGGVLAASHAVLSGAAGDEPGDDAHVDVAVYRGDAARGAPVRTEAVSRSGATWRATLPKGLAAGAYVAQVTQADDAGHVTRQTVSFGVVPTLGVIGGRLSLSDRGRVGIDVACLASHGSCTGDVLVTTRRAFRPQADGPQGPLRLMFAYVTVPAGEGLPISQTVSAPVLAVLRRAGTQPCRVTVVEVVSGRVGRHVTAAVRSVRVGG